MSKADLQRRNTQLRLQIIQRKREELKKEQERKEKLRQKEESKSKDYRGYPPLISTILKRLKRISPWNTVVAMDSRQAALICYYKLKQFGMKELRIAAVAAHSWVEFNYGDSWWIFDPLAIRIMKYGDPIKPLSKPGHSIYQSLVQYYTNPEQFYNRYDDDIELTIDECKIEAMSDQGLQSVLMIK